MSRIAKGSSFQTFGAAIHTAIALRSQQERRVELDYHGKQGSIVNFNFGHLMLNHAGIVSTCTLTLFSSSISSPTSFLSLFTNLSYTASVRKKKEALLSYIKALLLRYIKTQTFSAN